MPPRLSPRSIGTGHFPGTPGCTARFLLWPGTGQRQAEQPHRGRHHCPPPMVRLVACRPARPGSRPTSGPDSDIAPRAAAPRAWPTDSPVPGCWPGCRAGPGATSAAESPRGYRASARPSLPRARPPAWQGRSRYTPRSRDQVKPYGFCLGGGSPY